MLGSWFLYVLPCLYFGGFIWSVLTKRAQWPMARMVSLLSVVIVWLGSAVAALSAFLYGTEIDKIGLIVAALVSLLGWVIISYASRYLQGERNQPLFVRAVLFTIACVGLLIGSQHLGVIVLAWSATSIGLHYLLLFYPERKNAQIVAHKKFIVSRLADVCLLAAVVLIYHASGTLHLPALQETIAATVVPLSAGLHWAAALFVLAAILKSAQLPLHGWLIQVMEAPTPVSALLHAGVVNIGGFVMIRLGMLISHAPVAQALLVVVGSLTAFLAGLVMMTRISIKVRLAWSTCAQMGFMLMEVGLGLYDLALLHLVAHSLYKAHAFLAAGDTVNEARSNDFFTAFTKRSVIAYTAAAIFSGLIVTGSVAVWQSAWPAFEPSPVALFIVALGLAPLLWLEQGASGKGIAEGVLKVGLLAQLYLAWHALFSDLTPSVHQPAIGLYLWTACVFVGLYLVQAWLRIYPGGRLANTLYPWAYCGFYLDESFTRLTFKIWPVRLDPASSVTLGKRTVVRAGEF